MNKSDLWKTLDRRDLPRKRGPEGEGRECSDCGEWTEFDLLKEIDGAEYCDLCIEQFNRCDGCGERFSSFASTTPMVTRTGKEITERICTGCI